MELRLLPLVFCLVGIISAVPPEQLVRQLCQDVEGGIQIGAPETFRDLTDKMETMTESEIRSIQRTADRCESQKLKDLVNDAILSAAGPGTVSIVADQIQNLPTVKQIYFATSLAMAKNPNAKTIEAMSKLANVKDLSRHVVLAMSAYINGFCKSNDCEKNSVIDQFMSSLENEIARVCSSQDPQDQQRAKVLLTAAGNIPTSSNPQIVMKCAEKQQNDNIVRRLAIFAVQEDADEPQVQRALQKIALDESEDETVRISALIAAMYKASATEAQQLMKKSQQSDSKQVACYISSWLQNVKDSQKPSKQELKQKLASVSANQGKHQCETGKDSRNYEFSFVPPQLEMGLAVEGNLVMDEQDNVPKYLDGEVVVPVMDKEIQLFQIMIHQEDLLNSAESSMEKFLEIAQEQGIAAAIQQLISQFQSANVRSQRAAFTTHPRGRVYKSGKETGKLSVTIGANDKTVLYIDEQDLQQISSQEIQNMIESIKQAVQNPSQYLKNEAALGFNFLNNKYTVKTTNGTQAEVELDGTTLLGYTGRGNTYQPSFATDIQMKLNYGQGREGMKSQLAIQSSPKIEFSVRGSEINFDFPEGTLNVLTMKHQSVSIDRNGRMQQMSSRSQGSLGGCSDALKKPLNMEICAQSKSSNGQWETKVQLIKSEKSAKGWRVGLEMPQGSGNEIQTYRASFNTPGSQTDRLVSAELQFGAPRKDEQAIKATLRAPGNKIVLQARQVWNSQNKKLETRMEINNENYEAQIGLKTNQKDKKIEYVPQLKLNGPQMKPIEMTGSVILDLNRRTQLIVDLKPVKDSASYLKGNLVKDTGKVSASANVRVGSFGGRTFAAFEMQPNVATADVKFEYQVGNGNKQNAHFAAKKQFTVTGGLQKTSLVYEQKFSSNADLNLHVSINAMQKPRKHAETEINIIHKKFDDEKRKITILQVSRVNSQGSLFSTQHLLQVKAPMANIDLNLEGKLQADQSQTPKFRVEVMANDKASNNKVEAYADFKQPSKKPLRMSIEAVAKYNDKQVRYSDKLEEIAANEYKGKTQVQWPSKSATVDYHYKVRSDNYRTSHELNTQFKTSQMRHATQHQALLRMSRAEIEIRSKLLHDGAPLWDLNSLFSSSAKSRIFLDLPVVVIKTEASPFERSRTAVIELTGKSTPFHHQSDFALEPAALVFNTKTTYRKQPVFTLSSLLGASQSRLSVDSTPLFGKFDYNVETNTLTLELRSKDNSFTHKTNVNAGSNQLVVTSKTQSNGQLMADLDVALTQSGESRVNIETQSTKAAATYTRKPDGINAAIKMSGKNGKYTHKSTVLVTRRAINIQSNQQSNRQEIYDLNAQLAKSGPSKISVNTQDWKVAGEVDPSSNNGKIKIQSSSMNLDHNTNVNLGRQQWSIDSRTMRQGRSVAQIKARLADSSALKVDTEPLDVDFESQNNNMQLTVQYNPMRIVHKSRWSNKPRGFDLSSKTEKSGEMIVEYIFNVNEDARSLYKVAYKQWSAQVEYDAQANSAQVQLNGHPIRFTHITDVNWVPEKQWAMDSKSSFRGRPVLTINTLASAYGKSHLKFSKPGYEGSFEMSHKTKAKTARVVLKQSNPFVSHETEIEYHPGQHLVVSSKTDNNQNLPTIISSRIAGSGSSHVKVVLPMGSAGFIVEPQQAGKLIKVELERQTGIPISHFTKVSYLPSGPIVLSSSTKHGGRSVFDVSSRFDGAGKSFLNLQTLLANLAFELDPRSTSRTAYVKVEGLNTPYFHESELGFQPRRQISIVSQTRSGPRELFNLNSVLSQVGQSHVKVSVSPYNAQLRVQPFASSKVFGFNLVDSARAMKHEAEIKYQPSHITFNVVKKQGSVPVYTLSSQLSHQLKSFLKWEAGHQLANFEVDPFQAKNVKFVYHHKNADYKLTSQGSWLPGEFRLLNEVTQKGQMLAKLNALLSAMGESSLDTANPYETSILRVLPFGSQRYLRVQSKHLRVPAEHSLEVSEVPSGISIKSLTTRGGQSILDLSSLLSGSQKSHLKVVSPALVANAEIDPFGAEKQALFSFQNPQDQFDHLTEVQLAPGLLRMSARNTKKGLKSFHTETILKSSGVSTFKTQNKYFEAEGSYESKPLLKISYKPVSQPRRQVEFLAGRKDVSKNNIDLSLTWDASNPDAKIELSAGIEQANARNRRQILRIKGIRGRNSHFSLDAAMGESIIAGPHEVTIATRNEQGVTSLVLNHQAKNGQVTCTAQLIKNGQVKLDFGNVMSVESTRNGAKVKANIQVKSDYKAVDGLLFTLNHEYRSNHLMSEIIAQAPGSDKAIFRAEYTGNLDSRHGNIKGKLNVKLPGQKNQQLAVESTWRQNQVQLSLLGIDNEGKKAQLQGQYNIQNSRSQLSIKGNLDVKSDYESIDGLKIELSHSQGSGFLSTEATAQLPQQRQPANLNVKVNGRGSLDSGNVNAKVSANLPGTGRQELNGQATWSNNQGDFSLTAHDSNNQKTSLQGQYKAHGSSIKANIASKSDYKNLNNYRASLTHEPSSHGSKTEALVQIPNSEPAVIRSQYNANLNAQNGNLNWDVRVSLPSRQYVNQELHLRSKWNNRQGEVNLNTVANSGKKVQLQGQYNSQRDGLSGSLNLDSGFDVIPDVQAEGSLRTSASRPEVKLNVDVDKERVIEVAASGNVQNSDNFQGQAMVDTWATPKVNVEVQAKPVDSRNTKYSAVVKSEGETLMEVKANKGERNSRGQIFTNGSEWMTVEQNPAGTPEGTGRFFAQMRGAKHPLKIQYSPRWALY